MKLIFFTLFSYLIGSIPTAFILVKIFEGKDIRKIGSGNPGTTNVIRTTNIWLGIITFVVDFLKGCIPVLITRHHYSQYLSLIGFFAVLGHTKSIFLKFNGGKGVATFFGTIFVISQELFFVTCVVFIITLLTTHIVSISSLTSICFSTFLVIFSKNFNFISKLIFILIAALITIRHRENIIRLIHKQENRIF
ncbi:MAG: glycerol-3-phosphate 1-O-acyltransferase PlsY [Endomicrobiia bacterium]